MDSANLVRMANQIAAFFSAYPEDQAVAATADHIRQFWDPRMRGQLAEIVRTEGSGLSGIAHAAALRLRDEAQTRARAG